MKFVHGISYGQAQAFGPDDVRALLAMLSDPAEREYWGNAVALLGLIGDESAAEPLIDFLEAGRAEPVDARTFSALLRVSGALGLLSQREDSPGLRYLKESTRLEGWRRRKLPWTVAGLTDRERDILLVQVSISALGHSGTADGRAHLKRLPSSVSPELAPFVRRHFQEAMTRSDRVAREGLPSVLGGKQR